MDDTEAWVRIFEIIRPNLATTLNAITNTDIAFDAMKEKIKAEK